MPSAENGAGRPGKDGPAQNPRDGRSILPAATKAKPDRGNPLEGWGCPAYRRGVDLSIAAGLQLKHGPTDRELAVARARWDRVAEPDVKLAELMLARCAPSTECADLDWFWGLTREPDLELIVSGRLRGFVPPEFLRDAARVAAAVVFGAAVAITRRPHDSTHEHNALVRVLKLGADHAA